MKSVWSEETSFSGRESLVSDINVDVAVIGAGMAGILTAYLLQERGAKVVILEANGIASGVTKNTTAKITSQHDLIYDNLIQQFGLEKAKQYAMANEQAIAMYKDIIGKNNIDCDFEEKSAYVYSLDDQEIIEREVKAANEVGISAELVTGLPLPISVKAAVKFNGQGQFNPLKFLKPLTEKLTIYEDTLVTRVDGNTVYTEKEKVYAKHIVVATHYPFINVPGYYFMRMHQERSYVIALEQKKLDADKLVCDNTLDVWKMDGMYIDAKEEGYSFRTYKNLLLLGGSSHRTGKNHVGGCYDRLREVAKVWYPGAVERYHWSAQDCIPLDNIPYIGQYSSSTPNLYVATGFKKWGMTSSMVSAMILSDMIIGVENEYKEVFSPRRFHLSASAKNLAKDSAQAISGLTASIIKIPKEDLEKLECGHGGIVDYHGEKVGVYKEKNGECHIVSTRCTHLGCQLEWNPDEHSWDCPCHGSRFDYQGNLMSNPAMKGIKNQ